MRNKDCLLNQNCKKYDSGDCPSPCHPSDLIEMLLENSGIKPLYRNGRVENLPFKSTNEPLYKACERYRDDILNKVLVDCKGLFLVGGVGVGKTTVVTTLGIEYLIKRVISVYKDKNLIQAIPLLFINLQDLQIAYNTSFKIKNDLYSKVYLQMVYDAKNAELLILDDLCLRNITEAFSAELYSILDTRLNNKKCTFSTSNLGYKEMLDILGERSISRLNGLCGNQIFLNGKDGREGGIHWWT